MPTSTIFPSLFWFFSLKYSIIILLWLISSQKNHVSNQKSLNKSNNFQRDWWIIFCYIIFILHLKFYKHITYNLIFGIYFSFFILCDGHYFGPIIYSSHNIFVELFFKFIKSSSKLLNLLKFHNIIIKFGVHVLSKFWNTWNCTLR